jgi:hypothetical protein
MPTPTTTDRLTVQTIVDNIPDDGWLSRDSRETFINSASILIDNNWPETQVSEFLRNLFNAVTDEVS